MRIPVERQALYLVASTAASLALALAVYTLTPLSTLTLVLSTNAKTLVTLMAVTLAAIPRSQRHGAAALTASATLALVAQGPTAYALPVLACIVLLRYSPTARTYLATLPVLAALHVAYKLLAPS